MHELGDRVVVRTHDGYVKGRVIGIAWGAQSWYDIRTAHGEILVNLPEKNVQPAASGDAATTGWIT
jgi:hypothetical protein